MTTKISASNLSDSLITTITAGGGPKITAIDVTDDAWTVLDDTAVDLAGGYIKITGTGFQSGCQVLINNTPATATTFVSSTEVRAQVPAATAGTYVVYLANPDGGVAIAVNGITYSANPAWITGSTLAGQAIDVPISIQLLATDATTYALAAGSSLPTGVTLTSGGLLSGTVTGITEDTTYSFTVVATDAENQDSPRSFSVTVTAIVADDYFNSTVLLLSGDGANGAQNNTFIDASTNNFTITRNGNATQGSFSPFSPTGWGVYFDGTGDELNNIGTVSSFNFIHQNTGRFTIEGWFYPTAVGGTLFDNTSGTSNQTGIWAGMNSDRTIRVFITKSSGLNWIVDGSTTGTFTLNSWNHFAITYDYSLSSDNMKFYINGVAAGTLTKTANVPSTGDASNPFRLGGAGSGGYAGYISNFRIVNDIVYNSAFSEVIEPLGVVANTHLLACNSNRFVDTSNNAYSVSKSGDVRVVAFSPFAPTEAYDPVSHGGSIYFDGTGDWIEISSPTSSLVCTGDFTLEFWAYTDLSQAFYFAGQYNNQSAIAGEWLLYADTNGTGVLYLNGDNYPRITISTAGTFKKNEWQHIAIVRSSTSVILYVNGVSVGSTTKSDAFGRTGTSYDIGSYYTNANFAKGYMSGYRLVNGTAIYTANFTPPTAPPEAIANTSLLLNFTNGGISDATAKNVLETVGNSQVSTSVKKYGTGSIAFDGTGDYLVTSGVPLLNLGTGSFTWECWIYPNTVSGLQGIYATTQGSGTYPKFVIFLENSTPNIHYNVLTNGSNIYTASTGTITASQWTHLAFVRNGSTWTWYINGVASGTGSNSTDITFTTQPTYVGYGGESYFAAFNGYIDDLRITRGVARYTANFTPPDKALPVQ